MKLAICNETYRDWPWESAYKHAFDHGYRGLEVAPFTLGGPGNAVMADQVSSEQRDRFRALVEQAGLQVIGLHWLLAYTEGYHLTSRDSRVQGQTATYLRTLANLCGDLGGHVMVLGSPRQRNRVEGMSRDEAADIAESIIHQTLPELERRGVVLAIEPLGPEEGNFLNTAAEAIDFCRRFDSPFVKLHLDVKAMSTESQSIPDTIYESREWLAHFHANDPNRKGPGMGDVDFGPILQTLRDIAYHGWISVEVFDQESSVESLVEESAANLMSTWSSLQLPA